VGKETLGIKNKYTDTPVLITGCARSGTSIVAGIVNHCGAWGGNMTGRTRYNQKGQFENKAIRDQIVKAALRNAGYDPLGQKPLPVLEEMPIDASWRNRVLTEMRSQGYGGDQRWFYKGAKMCLFWPQWHFAFPNARWIIVRRDKEDIINSCLKTAFMRAYRDVKGWSKWVDAHLERFAEMHESGLNIIEVWPARIIAGRYGEIKNAIAHVGLKWNADVVHEFIEPRLWHGKSDKSERYILSDDEYKTRHRPDSDLTKTDVDVDARRLTERPISNLDRGK
jgi:hypothetical protein